MNPKHTAKAHLYVSKACAEVAKEARIAERKWWAKELGKLISDEVAGDGYWTPLHIENLIKKRMGL